MHGPEVIAFLGLLGVVGWTIQGIFRVIQNYHNRKFAARGGGVDLTALRAELEDIKARVGRSEELDLRVAELEERLDFTERVLAQQPGRQALPGAP